MPEKYAERYMCRVCGNVHGSVGAATTCYDSHTDWERKQAKENGYI